MVARAINLSRAAADCSANDFVFGCSAPASDAATYRRDEWTTGAGAGSNFAAASTRRHQDIASAISSRSEGRSGSDILKPVPISAGPLVRPHHRRAIRCVTRVAMPVALERGGGPEGRIHGRRPVTPVTPARMAITLNVSSGGQ